MRKRQELGLEYSVISCDDLTLLCVIAVLECCALDIVQLSKDRESEKGGRPCEIGLDASNCGATIPSAQILSSELVLIYKNCYEVNKSGWYGNKSMGGF